MNDIRTRATVYISLAGIERYDDQRFKNEELNKWIQDNVDILCCNFAKWGGNRVPYLAGVYLEPEQATIYKLIFGL